MVKALVTGGAGFIGSHLVGALRRKGVEVRVLDDLSTGKRSNLPKGVELLVGDVADPAVVERACRGVSVVFHLAAIASVARSIEDPLRCLEVNQGGTINVFEAAVASDRKPRVIYASSAAVYGRPTRDSLDEGQPTVPLSPYGADKRGSELHAAAAREVHGIASIGFRFFNVYGPRQDPTSPYSGVVSIFVDRALAGAPLTIQGDGTQVRDFVFVDDVVDCLLWAMERTEGGAEVFNICSGRGTSILDLAETVRKLCDSDQPLRFAPPRTGDIRSSIGDNGKLAAARGPLPRIELEQGLLSLMIEQLKDAA